MQQKLAAEKRKTDTYGIRFPIRNWPGKGCDTHRSWQTSATQSHALADSLLPVPQGQITNHPLGIRVYFLAMLVSLTVCMFCAFGGVCHSLSLRCLVIENSLRFAAKSHWYTLRNYCFGHSKNNPSVKLLLMSLPAECIHLTR